MRILIIEDEELAAEMLKNRLREILGSRITSLKIAHSLTSAVCYIQEALIDLLFLDLDLQGCDGFKILEAQVSQGFQTIIVSGNLDQAIRAFEYAVLDFIPKPYSKKRLGVALERYDDQSKWKFCSDTVPVIDGNTIHLVAWQDIYYISRSGKNAMIHLADDSFQTRKSLLELEVILPESFFRVHRSHIIHIKYLDQIRAQSGGIYVATLENGIKLSVSRTHYPDLKVMFKEMAGFAI